MLATLEGYQDGMWAVALESAAHLDRAESPGAADIARLRADFGAAMAAYQLFVHRELFELFVRSDTPEEVERARAIKTECILIAEDYRAFRGLWPMTEIAARWPDYRAAARDFRDRTRAHIVQVRGMATGPCPVHAALVRAAERVFSA